MAHSCHYIVTGLFLKCNMVHVLIMVRALSLAWPAALQIYWNKSVDVRKEFKSNRIGLDNSLVAISLFWDTVSSFENILMLEILWTQPRKV